MSNRSVAVSLNIIFYYHTHNTFIHVHCMVILSVNMMFRFPMWVFMLHDFRFQYAVKIGTKMFPAVTASKIKDARTEAAQIALQYLNKAGWMRNSQV